jgi:hypothetical protein
MRSPSGPEAWVSTADDTRKVTPLDVSIVKSPSGSTMWYCGKNSSSGGDLGVSSSPELDVSAVRFASGGLDAFLPDSFGDFEESLDGIPVVCFTSSACFAFSASSPLAPSLTFVAWLRVVGRAIVAELGFFTAEEAIGCLEGWSVCSGPDVPASSSSSGIFGGDFEDLDFLGLVRGLAVASASLASFAAVDLLRKLGAIFGRLTDDLQDLEEAAVLVLIPTGSQRHQMPGLLVSFELLSFKPF